MRKLLILSLALAMSSLFMQVSAQNKPTQIKTDFKSVLKKENTSDVKFMVTGLTDDNRDMVQMKLSEVKGVHGVTIKSVESATLVLEIDNDVEADTIRKVLQDIGLDYNLETVKVRMLKF